MEQKKARKSRKVGKKYRKIEFCYKFAMICSFQQKSEYYLARMLDATQCYRNYQSNV